ncbi:hypothetical protein M3194_23630 [Paenibacillus glycanilyticus]|uniref:hypothetical protein n=1 Tax=Paenibacillus glycanilyticus TaxID=126569 RepID=UPI0020407539|nr:hypothetical protein [Paenibacillus glycanilyticus]MCM3630327.1 hypothetical protein [Paenibacillus glycanilyticus]
MESNAAIDTGFESTSRLDEIQPRLMAVLQTNLVLTALEFIQRRAARLLANAG